jgi:hypothetical protein
MFRSCTLTDLINIEVLSDYEAPSYVIFCNLILFLFSVVQLYVSHSKPCFKTHLNKINFIVFLFRFVCNNYKTST